MTIFSAERVLTGVAEQLSVIFKIEGLLVVCKGFILCDIKAALYMKWTVTG